MTHPETESDPPRRQRKTFMLIGKIMLSLTIMTVILYTTDLRKISSAFQSYSLTTIVLAALIMLISAFWSAVKWYLLLPEAPFLKILQVSFIRYFYALILVGQITGDLSRIYKMGSSPKYSLTRITASVLMDRIAGFISLLLVGIIGFLWTHYRLPPILMGGMVTGVVVLLGSLFLLRFDPVYQLFLQLCTISQQKFHLPESILAHVRNLFDTIRIYAHNTSLLVVSIFSNTLFQIFCILPIMLLAGELSIHLQFIDWCWIFGVITVLLFFPISISGLGVREGSFIGILGSLGIAHERAMALSLSVFGLQVLLGVIGGGIELYSHVQQQKSPFREEF